MTETYTISSQIYYDTYNTCYKRILTLDRKPSSTTLNQIVKRLSMSKLSEFKQSTACCPIDKCIYAVYNPHNPSELLRLEDQALLITYLSANNFTINTSLTQLMLENPIKQSSEKQIMFFITNT
jgi:hypothetical protein